MQPLGNPTTTILIAALEFDEPKEQREYLDQACGEDIDLRERIAQLLRDHHDFEQRLLASTPADQPTPSSIENAVTQSPQTQAFVERPGSRIGPYRLLEPLGQGGMGIVFVAEQQRPLRRQVAIKLIKQGMDTREVVARFEHERQALALMDHPNIARVLDAGSTDSGRPYFVMEMVRGVPLTEYCDQCQLTPRERLELFATVCHAVQHAHQKGIIHRDLKPSNVLVTVHDGRPVAKVIDFGIAKAMNQQPDEATIHTRFSQMIGTPLYMSPEQAGPGCLDIDTRSDIYSLGVMLYELLTGRTPFDKQRLRQAAYQEIRRILCDEDPPKPSTRLTQSNKSLASIAAQRNTDPARLSRLLRGDLDWIVMKCLEKDRTRRYQTANGLACDVTRYLANEPVEAGPPNAMYRLRKFTRRHRAVLATLGAITAILILTTAFSVWQAIRATRAESETGLAMQEVLRERAKTGQALSAEVTATRSAREALNSMTDEVVEKLLAKQPQLDDNERAFLVKVIELYERLSNDRGRTVEAQAFAAEGQYRVARLNQYIGQLPAAASQYQQAIDRYRSLLHCASAVPRYRRMLALSLMNRGTVLCQLEQPAEADTAYMQAADLFANLLAEFPNSPDYRHELVQVLQNRGGLLAELNRPADAEPMFRRAMDEAERLVATAPNEPRYQYDMANGQHNLGSLLRMLDRPQQASAAYRKAIDALDKLTTRFPHKPEYRESLALCHFNWGCLFRDQQPAQAIGEFQLAVSIQKVLVEQFPGMPLYRLDLAATHHNLGQTLFELGVVLEETGDPSQALAMFRRASVIQEQLVTEFPARQDYGDDMVTTLVHLSHRLAQENHLEESFQVFQRVRERMPTLRNPAP